MLITPKSGYISGCFDSFPHIHLYLKKPHSLLLVKYWLDFSAHIRGPCMVPPCSPQNTQPGGPPNPYPPTGLSILHESKLPQSSISGPVVCTISDNSLSISYTQAAPPTKTRSHMFAPTLCHAPSCPVLSQCICLHNTVRVQCMRGVWSM